MRFLVLLLAITLFSTISAFGCECLSGGRTVKERAEYYESQADSVFTAKVVGFEYRKDVPIERMKFTDPDVSYETRMVLVKVIDWRKQEVPEILVMSTLRARIANGGEVYGSCDFRFDEGETYLIFAKKRNGYFATSSCSGSAIIKTAEPFLEFLGPANKPKPKEPLVFFSGLELNLFT